MGKVQVQCEVEQSGYDAIEHLAKIVKAVKAAGGFSVSAIPADIAALVAELPGLVSDAQQVAGDVAESALLFGKGCNIAAWDLADAFLAK